MAIQRLRFPTQLRRGLVIASGISFICGTLACTGVLPDGPLFDVTDDKEPTPETELIYFYVPGEKGDKDAKFSEWKSGDRLHVGVHDVNLRLAQTTDSEVLAELPVGMAVQILEVGRAEVLTQRRNKWYRVRTPRSKEGWVFGAALSPVVGMLDGRRGDAPAVVTFSPDFRPRVRVRDPGAGEAGQWAIDVTATDEFEGGVITATVEPVGNGRQLVVEQCDAGSERCGFARVRLLDGELVAVE